MAPETEPDAGTTYANSHLAFKQCVGRTIIGVICEEQNDAKTLIFEDGTGLTIYGNGAYGGDDRNAITRLIDKHRHHISPRNRALRDLGTSS